MSSEAEQQAQTQVEPVVVYPSSVSQAPPSISESHYSGGAGGSFAAVFIVVAVIIATSAIACIFGRICSRRMLNRTKPSKQKHTNNFRPKEIGDMELGFDGRIPTSNAKPPAGPDFHGDDQHSKGFNINGDPRMPEHHELDPMRFRMPGNYGDPMELRSMPAEHDGVRQIKPVDHDRVLNLKVDAYDHMHMAK